jgi:hypothetical protein
MAGFTASPAGGPEIGGVLYGTRTGNRVRIVTHRPASCEHAFGPAFELSRHDEAELERLLRETEAVEGDAALIPVGWYYSTYREMRLASQSAAVHDRWFAESWHVSMVFRRKKGEPVRVGLFPREADGSFSVDPSHEVSMDAADSAQAPEVWRQPVVQVDDEASQSATDARLLCPERKDILPAMLNEAG